MCMGDETDSDIYRRAVFEEFDRDHDEKLTLNEVAELFAKLSKKVTSYPAVSVFHGLYIVARSLIMCCRPPRLRVNKGSIWVRSLASSPDSMTPSARTVFSTSMTSLTTIPSSTDTSVAWLTSEIRTYK